MWQRRGMGKNIFPKPRLYLAGQSIPCEAMCGFDVRCPLSCGGHELLRVNAGQSDLRSGRGFKFFGCSSWLRGNFRSSWTVQSLSARRRIRACAVHSPGRMVCAVPDRFLYVRARLRKVRRKLVLQVSARTHGRIRGECALGHMASGHGLEAQSARERTWVHADHLDAEEK